MDIKAIAAVALDEFGVADVEDAQKGFFAVAAKKNFNAPAHVKTPKTETAQAQNSAQKPLGQQLFDLAKHDKSKHGGHFDPNTMSCKFRKEMAKSMTAMGLAIPEQVKQQLGEKNLKAAKQEGANLQQNDERVKAIQNLTKERNKVLEEKGKDSPEYKKAVEDVFNARMDFARQMIGNEEADAGEGLVEIAIDDSNPQKQEKAKSKVGELFDKAMNGEFNEAQNAELLAIGSKMGFDDKCKALEDKLFKPDSGINQEQMASNVKENEQNEAIQEQMKLASAQNEPEEPEEPEEAPRAAEEPQNTHEQPIEENQPAKQVPEGEGSGLPQAETAQEEPDLERPQAKEINPVGDPDEQHLQALEETISELDMDSHNDELSEYEKDVRHAAIANRAAKYLDSWKDLDDPEKRQRAVELAIQDIAKDEADGKHIGLPSENDTFQVSANQNRSDLSKAVDKARENLNKVMGDKNASSEERQQAREAFNAAKQAAEERGNNPTEEDLYEDQNSAKEELDKANDDLEAANKQLEQAEEALNTAQQTEPKDKNAIDNSKQAVEAANNAVEIAEQAKSEAEEKYNNAKDAFENYQPPATQEQREAEVNINSTAEMFEKAGIDADVVRRFKETQNMLNSDPQFYAKHPELLSGLKQDAEAWMRIKTDNEAMNGMLNSLKTVAADEISKGRIKNAVNDYLKDVAKSGDKELAQAAKEAQLKIAGGADPEKVKDEYDKKVRAIKAEQRKDELHQAAMREKNAKAYTAEANANQADAQAEAKTSKMQSDAAKSAAQAFAAEQKNKDDHMDQTWAEANADGRLNDLDAAIETLNKRKDDYGKAAAARLADIRKKLGEAHSSSQTAKLLKEWGSIVGGGISARKANISSAEELPASTKQNYANVDKEAQDLAIGSKLADKDTTGGLSSREKAQNQTAIDGIMNTLGVGTNVTGVIEGPTYSTYTLAKNPFVDESKIAAKIKNIQSALGRNDGVRVVTQKDGSLALQVPNKHPQRVNFGEIFKSNEWKNAKRSMNLPVILGKDGEGKPLIVDLASELHMLVGGATGQGKSVLMNSIVSSLMAARDAGEVDIDMLDPKAMEFTQYEDSPHLTRKPCTEPSEMAARIKDFESRMRKQQSALAEAGRKDGRKYSDVWEYNKAHPESKMKPAVLFIDECADVLNDKQAKNSLSTVLALGRAPGFHVVMATQRPSKEVMSSKTLANVESRIGFKTADSGDSETILDQKGAEDLMGRGDMLFKSRKGGIRRAQGAVMTDQENADLIAEINKAHNGKNIAPKTESETSQKVEAKPAQSRISRNEGESDAEYIKRLEAALNGGNG